MNNKNNARIIKTECLVSRNVFGEYLRSKDHKIKKDTLMKTKLNFSRYREEYDKEVLPQELKNFVLSKYRRVEDVGAEILFNEDDFKKMFPTGSQIRVFALYIKFKQESDVNLMKLKSPELMDKILVNATHYM